MILNKLTIHNIASIEDATIDFNAEPLSTASLFLICGTTGTGKSTILDCIALSLYGTSPRLQSSPQKSSADNEDIKLSDERQYLRRGTKEGFSILEFTGNDKIEYRAKILFRYNRNNNMDASKRTLEYENTILNKKGEIEKKIKEAIDIEYSQFCRTTLLAQGEFTKFLKSNDGDKSSILEKITGTEIYSFLGKKIFERSKEAESIYKEECIKLDNIQTLSEEAKNEYYSQIEILDKEQNAIEAQLTNYRNIKQWFDTKSDIENDIKSNRFRLEVANNKKDEIYYERQKTFTDKEKYSKIIDLYRNSENNKKELTEYQSKRDEYFHQFVNLHSDLKYYENILREKQEKASELALKYESIKDKTELYEQAPTIYGCIDRILTYKSDIINKDKEITNLVERQKEEEPIKAEINKKIEALTAEIEIQNSEAQEILKTLESLDFNKLMADINIIKEQQKQCNEVLTIINELNEAEEKEQKYREIIEKLKENLLTKEAENKKEENELREKKVHFENINKSKTIYNDTAKQIAFIRANLSKGDACPICGHIIEALPSEDNINNLAEEIKKEYESAKERLELLEKKHTSTTIEINDINKDISHLESNNKEVAEEVTNLTNKLNAILLYLELDNNLRRENIVNTINNKLIYNENHIATLIEKQQQYDENNNNYKITIKHKEENNRILETERAKLERITRDIIAIENNIASIKAVNKTKEEDINKELELLESTSIFKHYKKEENLYTIKQDLQQKQKAYKALTAEIDEIKAAIEVDTKAITEAKNSSQKIANQFKGKEIETLTEEKYTTRAFKTTNEIISELSTLYDEIVKNSVDIGRMESAIKEANTQIDLYLKQNKVDFNYIKELYNTSEETIFKYKNYVETIDKEIEQTTAILEDREKTLVNHLSLQSEEVKKMDIDECKAKIEKLEDEKSEKITRRTEITTILNNDKQNIEQYKTQREIVDKAKTKYDINNRLEKAFGDSEGKKFRMIAQSYILKELLSKSNDYLCKISDRYRLSCQPSTLNIEVSDDYMGGRTRPVNMMSGGESFIISLALALGLSNLNNRIQSSNILFIDEGFGTLDNNTLESVMNTLVKLHEIGGQKIGIISHVETLRERISTKIELTQKGSHSEISIYRNE